MGRLKLGKVYIPKFCDFNFSILERIWAWLLWSQFHLKWTASRYHFVQLDLGWWISSHKTLEELHLKAFPLRFPGLLYPHLGKMSDKYPCDPLCGAMSPLSAVHTYRPPSSWSGSSAPPSHPLRPFLSRIPPTNPWHWVPSGLTYDAQIITGCHLQRPLPGVIFGTRTEKRLWTAVLSPPYTSRWQLYWPRQTPDLAEAQYRIIVSIDSYLSILTNRGAFQTEGLGHLFSKVQQNSPMIVNLTLKHNFGAHNDRITQVCGVSTGNLGKESKPFDPWTSPSLFLLWHLILGLLSKQLEELSILNFLSIITKCCNWLP